MLTTVASIVMFVAFAGLCAAGFPVLGRFVNRRPAETPQAEIVVEAGTACERAEVQAESTEVPADDVLEMDAAQHHWQRLVLLLALCGMPFVVLWVLSSGALDNSLGNLVVISGFCLLPAVGVTYGLLQMRNQPARSSGILFNEDS